MTEGQYPTVDESLDRLHRAGWSVGHTGGATLWLVSGSKGDNVISARGRSLAEPSQATAIGDVVDPPVEFASCWGPTRFLGLPGLPWGSGPCRR